MFYQELVAWDLCQVVYRCQLLCIGCRLRRVAAEVSGATIGLPLEMISLLRDGSGYWRPQSVWEGDVALSPMSVVLAVSSAIKSDWTVLVAQRKADKAAERARVTAKEAENVRESAREALLSRAAAAQLSAAPERTSGKNFGTKDPLLALTALDCIELESDAVRLELSNVDLVVSKYCVRSLATRLTQAPESGAAPPFVSVKAANMMSATTVRFLFDVACEMAETDAKSHEAKAQLQWHDCQKMLKNDKSTRGVGIVAYTEVAMALLKEALTAARGRIQVKIDAKKAYEAAMYGGAAVIHA